MPAATRTMGFDIITFLSINVERSLSPLKYHSVYQADSFRLNGLKLICVFTKTWLLRFSIHKIITHQNIYCPTFFLQVAINLQNPDRSAPIARGKRLILPFHLLISDAALHTNPLNAKEVAILTACRENINLDREYLPQKGR